MKTELRAKILGMLEQLGDGISFAEVVKIPGARGESNLLLDGDEFSNVYVWSGMSSPGIAAIQELLSERKIEFKGASVFTYAVDGEFLELPLARSKRHYKKPHWAPMVIYKGKKFNKSEELEL